MNILDLFHKRSNSFMSVRPNIAPASVWENPIHFIAFGFGCGAFPYAPGTFSTLMAIPFYLLFAQLPLILYGILLLILITIGIYVCGKTCKEIGVHDHPGASFDEFVGFFVTMFAAPAGWMWIVVGFILFRIFDIWKPWPIGWVDKKVPGGLGIVLDDVVAGIFANVFLHILAIPFL